MSKIKYRMVNTKTNKLLKVNKKSKNLFRRQYGKHTFKGQKLIMKFQFISEMKGLSVNSVYREYRPIRSN